MRALSVLLLGATVSTGAFVSRSLGQWVSYGVSPRAGHSAIYDSATDKMIVFGGEENLGTAAYNDVWTAINIITSSCGPCDLQWSFVTTQGTPPAPRFGHTAVYDSTHSRMIVFGGGEGSPAPCANDVWVLSNANGSSGTPTWTELNPAGTLPAARMGHAAFYDSTTNRMVVFGGTNCDGEYLADTWVLANANGLNGTPTWKQTTTVGSPPARASMAWGYDSSSNSLVVFGGTNGSSLSDLWVLSNANGKGGASTWTELSPQGTTPSARYGPASGYDSTNNRMIMQGGTTAQGMVSDAWVLSNANGMGGSPSWQLFMPPGTSPVLTCQSGIYDPVSDNFVVFGGFSDKTTSSTMADNHVFVLTQANGLAPQLLPH